MSMITQEDAYLTVDCPECNFNLLVVHNHGDNPPTRYGALEKVLKKDLPS